MLIGSVGLVVPLVITVVGEIAVLFGRRTHTLRNAAIAALVMAISVPAIVVWSRIDAAALAGMAIMLLTALIRGREHLRNIRGRLPLVFVALLAWTAVRGYEGYEVILVQTYISTLIIVLLFALVLAADPLPRQGLLLPLAPIVLFVETALAISEQLGARAVWLPTGGRLFVPVNSFIGALKLRSLGTTGYAITFGIMLVFFAMVCAWYAVQLRRRWLWIPVACAAVSVIFSGTRSAAIAAFVSVIVWLLQPAVWTRMRALAVGVVGLAGAAIAAAYVVYAIRSGLFQSSAFQIRLGAIGTIPTLLRRPPLEVLFGTGFFSIHGLLLHGLMGPNYHPQIFDNEVVRELTSLGLLGIVILAAVVVTAFVRGGRFERVLLAVVVTSFFFYDTLTWRLLFCLLALCVVPEVRKRRERRHRATAADRRQSQVRVAERRPEQEPVTLRLASGRHASSPRAAGASLGAVGTLTPERVQLS